MRFALWCSKSADPNLFIKHRCGTGLRPCPAPGRPVVVRSYRSGASATLGLSSATSAERESRSDSLLPPASLRCTTPVGLTDWMGQSAGFVTHGPMPPIRMIEYRTMKPGSDPSGAGTSASGET
jgi:hypothetical protein